MDNFQFWLYIIIAVIYVLSRVMKKSNQPARTDDVPREREPERTTPSSPTSRPLTFEELLREITESKSTTPKPSYLPPKPAAAPKPSYVDYDDDLKEEEEDLEDVDYDYRKRDKSYDVYEEAKKQAFLRPSLEETPKLQENELKYTKFKEFSKERKRTILDEYVEELRSPSGFKKAIVLSEILKPRF